MLDLNKKRSQKEWQILLNNVKVSDLEFEAKSKLINEIECKMLGVRNPHHEALKQISDSMPDYSDMV